MKNKYIKIIFFIIIILAIISITTVVKAVSFPGLFEPQRGWKHTDPWNGHSEFFSYLSSESPMLTQITNNGIIASRELQLYLCRQKGGAIRFSPVPRPELPIGPERGTTTSWCNTSIIGHTNTTAKEQEKKGTLDQVMNKVESLIDGDDSHKASTDVGGIYAKYKGTYFPVTQMGQISPYEYYSTKPYATTPIYYKLGDIITVNNSNDSKRAYIMSAGKDFAPTSPYFNFKQGNYVSGISDIADYQLIQDALWLTDFNEGNSYNYGPSEAYGLVQEAQNYQNFYNNVVATGYENKVSTDSDRAQVIVNRDDNNENNSNFIMGPFKITYPDQNPFSYIEDMYIIAKNEVNNTQTIVRSFEVITASGTRTYPSNNEEFYVKFNAKEAGYPTSADVRVTFAYLASCNAQYQNYEGRGEVYQIRGKIEEMATGEQDTYTWPELVPDGTYDPVTHKPNYTTVTRTEHHDLYSWYYTIYEVKIGDYPAQKLAILGERNREWKRYEVSVTVGYTDLTMDFGGLVWEDTKGGKTTDNDNVYDPSKSINEQTDKPMSNVIVTLYNKDGTIAKLSKDNDPNNDAEEQVQNPTKTDSNGQYKFTGINSMFQYYVEFTYNSQYYEPVEYVSPTDSTNGWAKGTWKINSNGTDVQTERENINARFASIGSSPNNYQVNGKYNKTYTKQELLGNELAEDGKTYIKSSTRYVIIDEFGNLLYNSKGEAIVKDYSGKEILVSSLTGDKKTDVDSKIQYVKDCQLSSYTGKDTVNAENKAVRSNDLYPIYSSFVIDNHKEREILTMLAARGYVDSKIPVLYENDANLYINQGYTLRRLADLALKKDVYNVNVQINDKQHIYEYDTRKASDESAITNPNGTPKGDTVWDIGVRIADGYYNTEYSRELQVSDYEYKIDDYNGKAQDLGKTEDSELKVYITYKITVRNQSQTIKMRLDELVDYYDEDLAYSTNNEKENAYILDNSYAIINKNKYNITRNDNSRYGNDTQTAINGYDNLYVQIENSPYLESGQTAYIYLTFIVKKDGNRNVLLDEHNWKLDAQGNIVSTPIGVGKENIAEINGYSTIYGNNTTVPNVGDVSGKVAGIVDRDSNPGNLNPAEVPKDGTINYKKLEDDTDKAPNIKLKLRSTQDENRLIDGIVWEDERNLTNEEQKTTVANGIMDNGETGINGVTVQLVELMENGKEYIWSTKKIIRNNDGSENKGESEYDLEDVYTKNNGTFTPIINMKDSDGKKNLINDVTSIKDGYYAFKSYPAGNYIVRFIYGDTIRTVLPNSEIKNEVTKLTEKYGDNAKSYTGQDYKSTSYQKVDNVANRQYTYTRNNAELTIDSTTDAAKYINNTTGTFYYDISAFENLNVSDAKDIMVDNNNNTENMRQSATLNSREDVENYSNKDVTNHIAEVLASHEQLQDYYNNEEVDKLLVELMDKTAMTAETGVIDIEVEKDTKETLNQSKDNTMQYKIQNVNLGLEERPKAQLAINKEVTNVKLTLADGSTLFDATQTASNVLWKNHIPYNVTYKNNMIDSIENIRKDNANIVGLIQLSMDEELMHGATIRISYKITVTNVGEVDYYDNKFYYTGTTSDITKVVKTQANQVIDYVANNLQFDSSIAENKDWKVIKIEDLTGYDNINNDLVNSNLKDKLEQYNTIITTSESSNIAKTQLVPTIYNKIASQVSDDLVLTQLITSENNTDDLTYKNIVEIVKTSNTVGRRNEYSVVGNQDPTKEPQEMDSDKAEVIRILPPFGNAGIYIIIATTVIIAIGILASGIIFIKKKVLK